ncbi:hypothetical protein LJR016_005371 [Devosia sp. LjRoot16]|uniref:hypothetical protein n=1 Tax=Devosia sp. LjRoot16 TaxID=3342271 RepID=UPI003ECD21D0
MTTIEQPIAAAPPHYGGAVPYRHLAMLVLLALAGIALRGAVFAAIKGGTDVSGYVHALCVWDCGWYRTIAEGGYDLAPGVRLRPGAANWAFFPLSPTLAALLGRLTGLSAEWAGFIVSNTAAILAALAARPLFNSGRAYWLFATGLLVGPFSFLFSSLHTEALFILMTTLALRALSNSRFVVAGLATALLSATRVTGVLMVFAMLAKAVEDHLTQGGRWRDLPLALIGNPPLLLGLALAPAGLFAYIAWLQFQVGDGLAFVHIQRAWGRELVNPLSSLAVLTELQWPMTPAGMVVASWAAAAVIGLVLCVVLLFQRRVPAAIFCALCILVSLSAGQTSLVRFVAGLAPLGWALSALLARWTPAWVLGFLVAIVLDVVLTIGWINSSLFVM